MRQSIALLLVGLICAAAFTTDLFEKHRDDFQSRNIMEIMVQVENQIKAGTPFDTVNAMLADFKTAVSKEQAAHDDLYARQKGECDSEIGFRQKEVGDANKALQSANSQLNSCSVQRGKAQAELGITQDHLIMYRQHLELVQEVRRVEQENFSRGAVVFNDAIRALEDSLYLCQEFQTGGASLAQMADQTGKMMKHAVHLGKTQNYAAVLASLARMSLAQQVDASDVERLVQLLNTLKGNLQENYNDYVAQNNKGIELFNEQKERITNNVARLEKSEQALDEEISELNGCVAQQTALSQAASNKKSRNQKLWDDANGLCSTFEEEYQAASSGRRQELTVLAELERLVERRRAQTSE